MTVYIEAHWKPLHEWEKIRYDASHFVLSFLYFLLLVGSIVMFAKFQYYSKYFVGIFLVGILTRMASFIISPFVQEDILTLADSLIFFISTMPAFFLFSAYLVLLFFWGAIFEEENLNIISHRTKIVFHSINTSMFIIAAGLYIADLVTEKGYSDQNADSKTASPTTVYQVVIQVFAASMYILVSFGFFVYGYYIHIYKRDHFPDENAIVVRSGKKKLLKKIGLIGLTVMVCFLIRAGFTLANLFKKDIGTYWAMDLVYYSLLELIPLTFMLGSFISSKSKPKLDDKSPLLAK